MEIKGKEYEVVNEQAVSTVIFKGELALMGMGEYPPIANLLEQCLEDATSTASKLNFRIDKTPIRSDLITCLLWEVASMDEPSNLATV